MSPLVVCVAAMAGIVVLVAWMAWVLHRIDRREAARQAERMYAGRRPAGYFDLPPLDASLVPVTDAEWRAACDRLFGPPDPRWADHPIPRTDPEETR